MSETKVQALNLVSEASLRLKQQNLRDKSIPVSNLESILSELEAKEKQNEKQ
jgi:hypothetical protein